MGRGEDQRSPTRLILGVPKNGHAERDEAELWARGVHQLVCIGDERGVPCLFPKESGGWWTAVLAAESGMLATGDAVEARVFFQRMGGGAQHEGTWLLIAVTKAIPLRSMRIIIEWTGGGEVEKGLPARAFDHTEDVGDGEHGTIPSWRVVGCTWN